MSSAIPVLVGGAAGNPGAGLIATLGAFTSRYGIGRPYLSRGLQLAVVAAALAGAVALGAWASAIAWLGVLTVSAVAVTAVWLCNALAVGPPGAYVFVVACAAGIGVSASHLLPWQIALLVLAGGAVAWTLQMLGATTGFRRPERAAVTTAATAVAGFIEAIGTSAQDDARRRAAVALHAAWKTLVHQQPVAAPPRSVLHRLHAANHAVHVVFADAMAAAAAGVPPEPGSAELVRRLGALDVAPESVAARDADRLPPTRPPTSSLLRQALLPGSHTRRVMVRVAIGVPLAGAAAVALGVDRAYWAMATAVLVLHQGTHLSGTLRRGAERLLGTWIGLGLAAVIIVVHPRGVLLALVLALLQFAIEMLVTRNYTLASMFITATALTIASGTRDLSAAEAGHLLLARGVDTLIGCAVGLAVYLLLADRQEADRLVDALARTHSAADAAADHLDRREATSLAARTARRDLQRATLDLLDAYEAARHGQRDQRASAAQLLPEVMAAEQRSYRTIAALWAVDAAPRRR
ncbi:putative membrane protein [Mycolicibacterium chubuense NBB4]|uniref:Putative membrane protein n=1 Tax=Mycolicibacterium chubuense (strain NBB4) TaxID=710421 RepID=I4BDA4_MYCCN|nr:putative membrane protein [Mycolicibacterium chubuense NBB4]